MIVVSDTSVLSCLAEIGELELLRCLYGAVTITETIRAEACDPRAPERSSQMFMRRINPGEVFVARLQRFAHKAKDVDGAHCRHRSRACAKWGMREAARDAAAQVRREMLNRGLTEALGKGNAARVEKYREALDKLPQTGNGPAVHDDGAKIILENGLEERYSKIRKREGESETSAKQTVAQKVFDSIDIYAENPRRAVIPSKIADRSRQLFAPKPTITPDERKLLKSPLEILLIYDREGKLKRLKMGEENRVIIPNDTADNAILSHNHPSGRGPSGQDLKTALENPGMTLRIVARNEKGKIEIFSFQALKVISKEEIDGITTEYKMACNLRGESHQGRRDSLALILENYGDILTIVTEITK